MDSFCEHLVERHKGVSEILVVIFLWVAVIAVIALSVLYVGPLSVVIAVVGIYMAVKLTQKINVEYEYIFTNGEIDIDIITARSNRKRLITFKAEKIEQIEKYNAKNPLNKRSTYGRVGFYCNADDKNAYCIVLSHPKDGKVCLVMDIPEKMQQEMLPYLDKLLAREVFKEK